MGHLGACFFAKVTFLHIISISFDIAPIHHVWPPLTHRWYYHAHFPKATASSQLNGTPQNWAKKVGCHNMAIKDGWLQRPQCRCHYLIYHIYSPAKNYRNRTKWPPKVSRPVINIGTEQSRGAMKRKGGWSEEEMTPRVFHIILTCPECNK